MKRFRFTLETLLEVRKRKEEAVALELGKKNGEIAAGRRELIGIGETFRKLQESEKKKRADVRDVVELRYSVAYRFKLKKDMLATARRIEALGTESAAIRKKLVRAQQQRRAIEIVRDRHHDAWRKEYRSREQKFVDDISQQAFIRRTSGADV